MCGPLPSGYIIHEARMVRENGRWHLSLLGYAPPVDAPETRAVAGVDVGINPLAVVHGDGVEDVVVENPRALYGLERGLRRWQRAQSRRTRGSRGWWEAQRLIDKCNRRIKALRDNAQHQLSAWLVREFGHIGIESLRVKGLMKNHHLSKALADSAMSKLLRRIRYKAQWYGRQLTEADPLYPSSKTCFACGAVNQGLKLEKTWVCPGCGAVHDRDVNAARNLHKLALPAGRGDVTLPDGKALASDNRVSGETSPAEGRTRPNCRLAFAN